MVAKKEHKILKNILKDIFFAKIKFQIISEILIENSILKLENWFVRLTP